MAFGATAVDVNSIPIGSAYIPQATTGGTPYVMRGGNKQTDGGSNVSAAAAFVAEDGWKASYRLAVLGFVPVATPTDIITIQGVSNRTVKITRFEIGGIATTAGGISWQLVKRTAANTGGTTASLTTSIMRMDTNDAAATATAVSYSANATGLGAGTNIKIGRLFLNLATAQPDRVFEDFGDLSSARVPTLRGTGEYLAVNLNGSTLPAGTAIDVLVEWTEDLYS